MLGTAQWGAEYGITNRKGRLTDADLAAIVSVAQGSGITAVDTAAGYGDAQTRLRRWSHQFAVRTKISGKDAVRIPEHVQECLEELDVARLDGCLLHDWDALEAGTATQAAGELERTRTEGFSAAVGVSVYDENALRSALDAFESLDMVQVPANALDRRLDGSPVIEALSAHGTVIQVRSAFLQGLLTGPSDGPFRHHPDVQRFWTAAKDADQSPLAMALAHVRALPWASEIVVGVTSADELQEVLQAWTSTPPRLASDRLASDDIELIDPRLWGSRTGSVRMDP